MDRRRPELTLRQSLPRRHRLRSRLLAGSAFAALALTPVAALAQLTAGGAAAFSAGGGAPVIAQNGRTTDVTLNASRTILPWSSFRLTSDQAVVYRFQDRGGIVLNKIGGQAVIDGSVESLVGTQRGAGNVWFQAPGGVIFGPNARTNVGGLLATSGAVAEGGFLDPGNLSFNFTGAGAARIELQGGAQVSTAGGALVLVAGAITSDADSAVSGAGSTVLLGAASEFTVRFTTSAGDLDLVDFVVPSAAAGTSSATPFALRGQVVGANVFLSAVNRADVASAVISAPGLIAAQSATTDRGDVVLAAGVGIVGRQPGLTRINSTTETTASFGVVSAQRDLLGGLASPTTLVGQQFGAGRDLGFAAASLDAANLNAGRLLAVDANRGITIRGGASSGSQVTLRTAGALVVGGGAGGLNALGQLQIDAGSVQVGQLNAGRSVTVNASGVGPTGAAVSIGAIIADDDITITTTNTLGHIVLGSASFTGLRVDEAPSGHNLNLTARGAQADVSYGGATGAALTGATRASLNAGRDVTAKVSGPLTLSNSTAGRDLTATASGPLTITGGGAGRDLTASSGGSLSVTGVTVIHDLIAKAAGLLGMTGAKAGNDLTANTTSGALTIATASAGRNLVANGADQLTISASTAGGDLSANTAGPLTVSGSSATQDLIATAGGALAMTGDKAGRNLFATATGPSTLADSTAGGDLTANAAGQLTVSGSTATRDLIATAGGSLAMTGDKAGRNLSATATGSLTLGASTAGGDLTANTTGQLTLSGSSAAQDLIANTGGPLAMSGDKAGRNLSATATGLLTIADSSAAQDLTATTSAGLTATGDTATRDLTLSAGGLLSVAGDTAGRDALFRAGDLEVTGAIKAASLRVESLPGALTLGGSLGPNGASASPSETPGAAGEVMRVTDAEFGRITVTDKVSFYAGAAGSPARGDLTVLDLHVTPSRTPSLLLAAGPSNDVAITGALAPGISGGTVTVGDATAGSGFLPGRILLTGSIGVAAGSSATGFIDVHALSETHLSAAREIILGSSRFIALVSGVPADQIDIAHDLPTGVAATPEEQGHVFIATGVLTMSAPTRILMQNTGTRARPDGLFIDGTAPDPPPAGTPTVLVSTTGVVDLFGTFRDMTGTMTGGVGAGLAPGLKVTTPSGLGGPSGVGGSGDGSSGGGSGAGGSSGGAGGGSGGGAPTDAPGPTIRFNGLDVGPSPGGGGGPASRLPGLIDPRVQMVAQGQDASLTSPSDAAVNGLPPEVPVLTTAEPDEDVIAQDPVPVATGSYEIWHRKSKRK